MNDILNGKRLGFAFTGSFCTFERAFAALEALARTGAQITPIFSEIAGASDTRFGRAEAHKRRAEELCGRSAIGTILQTEPIGPQKLLELLIVAPCTGATMARISLGLTDSCVAMAAKAHLRNERPILLAPATNDGLTGSAESFARLLNRRHVYFVPFGQDDPQGKPASLVSKMEKLSDAARLALEGRQMQPILA